MQNLSAIYEFPYLFVGIFHCEPGNMINIMQRMILEWQSMEMA